MIKGSCRIITTVKMSALEVDIQTRTLREVSVMPSESSNRMNKSTNEEQSEVGGLIMK